MLVLIAGATGLGKSSLARVLRDHFSVASVLSTSDVREALRSLADPVDHAELFASTYKPDGVDEDLLCYFERQSWLVMRAVSAVVRRSGRGVSISIVEGTHVTPSLLEMVEEDSVRVAVLLQPSASEHQRLLVERGLRDAEKPWVRYEESFRNIRAIGTHIERTWRAVDTVPVQFIRHLNDGAPMLIRDLIRVLP